MFETRYLNYIFGQWHAFFGLLGGGAPNLIGLMFVAISVGSKMIKKDNLWQIHIFITPAIVHLLAVISISAIVMVPWPNLMGPHIALTGLGAAGFGYLVLGVGPQMGKFIKQRSVAHRERFFNTAAPGVCYALVLAAGLMIRIDPLHLLNKALGLAAIATLLLALISVRLAWVSFLYLVTREEDVL